MIVYGDHKSGNCYKVALTAALLDMDYEWRAVDVLKKQTHTPEFLALNPNGKIPLLLTDDGRSLAESNAIIFYLAQGSRLIPADAFSLSRMLSWQFFEQYSHEPFIAVARFIEKYLGRPAGREAEYHALKSGGYHALDVMERQLAQTPYLCGDIFTLADISLFAYTHIADEGGFDLAAYPAIRAWINRVRAQPGFAAMQAV